MDFRVQGEIKEKIMAGGVGGATNACNQQEYSKSVNQPMSPADAMKWLKPQETEDSQADSTSAVNNQVDPNKQRQASAD